MPVFLPDAEKAIYLDDDVIVQGEVHSFIVSKDPRIHILSTGAYPNILQQSRITITCYRLNIYNK